MVGEGLVGLNHPELMLNSSYACYNGSLKAAETLIRCNINTTNREGNTPLHIAYMGGAITKFSDPFLKFLSSKQGFDRDSSEFCL